MRRMMGILMSDRERDPNVSRWMPWIDLLVIVACLLALYYSVGK